jgi:hypothetical protein
LFYIFSHFLRKNIPLFYRIWLEAVNIRLTQFEIEFNFAESGVCNSVFARCLHCERGCSFLAKAL